MGHVVRTAFAALAALVVPCATLAQDYPKKPMLVILPMQSASASDVMVRLVAQRMAENMKQQTVIVNMPGAAGLIGTERIARAAADGYTIGGLNDGLLTQIPYLYQKVPYDPVRSFDPVSMVAAVTYVLIVHPSVPAKSLKELIALARSQPGRIDFASGGVGNAQHFAMELFNRATGASFGHVPYRGATAAGLDVIGGRVPAMFSSIAVPLPAIKEGRLRALAVPSEKRSPLLPDTPTFQEAGVPNFVFFTYTALYVPAGTPKPIVQRLNDEAAKALSDPAVKERLLGLGLEPASSTPEQLGRLIESDRAKMIKVIKEANIHIEPEK
jgi:tripartite-type tricarboxylate transporter receptor subunit TctC